MRILHIVPIIANAATYGGPARGTIRQATESARRGGSVTVMALSPDVGSMTRRDDSGVEVVLAPMFRLPGHRIAGAMSFRGLRWLRSHAEDFDVVHVHAGREIFTARAMIFLGRKGIPFVLQTHGMLAPRTSIAHRIYDALLTRRAISKVSRVLALTNYEQRDLETFVSRGRIARLVNGIDNPNETPQQPDHLVPQIVYLSRLHPRKRAEDLLEAVAELNRVSLQARVSYFGPDEGALGSLLARIDQLDATAFAEYRGTVPYLEVRQMLGEFDIFVLPSVNEPFPNSLLEAMANGMAVICTSSCGLAPYIRDAEAGLVVEPGAENIHRALAKLVGDPALRLRLGTAALELVRREFSMNAVVDSLTGIYATATSGWNWEVGSSHFGRGCKPHKISRGTGIGA